ncbi:MAG: hypothetical protein GY835_13420 [bacterium]|nr:hypothetical protein [bacterium]
MNDYGIVFTAMSWPVISENLLDKVHNHMLNPIMLYKSKDIRSISASTVLVLLILTLPPLGCSHGDDTDGGWGRTPAPTPRFGERENVGMLEFDPIDEASGLAASRRNPGVLWTHNDSGDEPRIFALNEQGKHLGVYSILNATAQDWEDIAVGPGPAEGRQYIYIGETGDNKARYETRTIYRVPEPVVRSDQEPIVSALSGVEAIRYHYPDGKRDAEAIFVDPLTRDIYVTSKREERVAVYRLPWPQDTSGVSTPIKLGTLPLTKVNSGDITPSGREIVLKTYDAIYYWTRGEDQSVWDALQGKARLLPYYPEVQGESFAWRHNEQGYFTLSEEKKRVPAFLYYYPRQPLDGD